MTQRTSWLTRATIGLLVLAALAWLFLRTVRDARATPYTVRSADLRGWQVVTEGPGGAAVGLQPPSSLTADLFKQVFTRNMESLSSPASPQIPILLREEAAGLSEAQLEGVIAAVRDADLSTAGLVPRCLATRRSDPPGSYDYYFLHFDPAPLLAARGQVRSALEAQGGDPSRFDPSAVDSTLLIATSDPSTPSTIPFQFDSNRDCIAPIVVE
jgi:hypothetical protein